MTKGLYYVSITNPLVLGIKKYHRKMNLCSDKKFVYNITALPVFTFDECGRHKWKGNCKNDIMRVIVNFYFLNVIF